MCSGSSNIRGKSADGLLAVHRTYPALETPICGIPILLVLLDHRPFAD
jgi:hypothetical protein